MHARSALRGVVAWSIGLMVAASSVAVEPGGDRGNRDSKETALMTAVDASPVESAPDLGELVRPLRSEAEVRRYVITAGGGAVETTAGPMSTDDTSRLAYSNTLGKWVFGPSAGRAGVRIADDITTTAGPGCDLDRYVIMVSGDKDGDGSVVGPFAVDVGLYEMCPGASTEPVAIEGTSARVELPDNGTYAVVLVIPPDVNIPIPSSLYLGVSFSRDNVGVVVGAPATVGFSDDRFDYPGFPCAAGLGGFPWSWHASFYAQIYVRDKCPASFPGYINSNHGGTSFSAGRNRLFADRIRLAVDECNLIGYQLAHKGNGIIQVDLKTELSISDPENGGMIPDSRAFVWSFGDDIQVHRQFFAPIDLSVYSQVWVAFRTTTAGAGPVLTCKWPSLGDTDNEYIVYGNGRWDTVRGDERCWLGFNVTLFCEGTPPIGACCDMILTDNDECVGGSRHGIVCANDFDCPRGKCVGDSVCRELPQMNCAFPESWTEGAHCGPVCVGGGNDGEHCTADADCRVCLEGVRDDLQCCPGGVCNDETGQCEGGERDEYTCCPDGACMPGLCEGSFCVGGDNDAQACSVQADCPGGDCPGPFAHSCGLSACCKPDDTCENLTKEECYSIPPAERVRMWQLGRFCGEDGQRCPINACIQSVGECRVAHPEPGCKNGWCCAYVCLLDPWCCQVEWDELCVRWSRDLCWHPPHNDDCYSPYWDEGAFLVEVPSTTDGDHINNRPGSDPGFCCHTEDPGAQGFATVWYKFVATDTSARLSTCESVGYIVREDSYRAEDSLLAVFSVSEPDLGVCRDESACSVARQDCADGLECVFDEQTACETLTPIACNDDDETCDPAGPAGPQPRRSTLCVTDLVPGELYYVMVAAKTDAYTVNPDGTRVYADKGVYRLDITSPCSVVVPPRLHNDWCLDAEEWTGGDTDPLVIPFDISGGAFGEAPATFDCPGPSDKCMSTLENDVWYDWTSPCTGVATIETCQWFCDGGSDRGLPCSDDNDCADPGKCRTPDTGLVVYEGCECPVETPRELVCNDFQHLPCRLGSKVTFDAVEGACYKLRLGGHRGGEPAGDLSVSVDCALLCPLGTVTFDFPPSGVVEARRPHPPDDPSELQGLDTFFVVAPEGADASCWTVCETNENPKLHPPYPPQFETNGIYGVQHIDQGVFTLILQRPITPGEVTTITYTDDDGIAHTGSYFSHPANVDGDGVASPNDVLVLIDVLNGSPAPPWSWFSTDCDHSGLTGPADIICVVDLLNHGWLGTTLPRNPGTCP